MLLLLHGGQVVVGGGDCDPYFVGGGLVGCGCWGTVVARAWLYGAVRC